jgi:ketosteroid isomerase-like protein
MHAADDVTYMDANVAMVEGAEAFRAYAASLADQVPPHTYVLDDPRVQVYGDVAILTFQWLASDTTGAPMAHWHATSVYRLDGDAWRLVHGHWSPFGAE